QKRLRAPVVAVTSREGSATRSTTWRAIVVAEGDGRAHRSPEMHVEVREPIGAGDAFAAGLIFGRVRYGSWDEALRCGAALVTLKYQTPGDFSQATLGDVERVLAANAPRAVNR